MNTYASHGTIEENKEKLVNDIRTVIGDADTLLKGVAGSAADEFAGARSRVETRLAETRLRLNAARDVAARSASAAAESADEFVRENPWKLLGITALAALLVGIVLSRR